MPRGIYKRTKKHREICKKNGAMRKNFFVSKETRDKISQAQKGIPRHYLYGNKNPNWKGGVTGADQIERCRVEFINWRTKVFDKNKKECLYCKSKKMLVAHHKKSFKKYPKLRYEVDNGVVVCRSCHIKIHRNDIQKNNN